MDFIFVALGLIILLLAGDVLVRGAVNVSIRLGVPALIVSLTIVAIGTSAPEMLVAIDAVMEGSPGLAVGNVVGSNIANVLLVLGVPALLFGLATADSQPRRAFVQMMLATGLFAGFTLIAPLSWPHGLLLIAVYLIFIGNSVYVEKLRRVRSPANVSQEVELDSVDPAMPWVKIGIYLALGLIGLPLGAEMLVNGATEIARSYHISETVIGLTLVAIGTSLPELATTVTAAYRGQTDVALGNVIGSNIANLLAIIGVAALFGDIPVSQSIIRFDLWAMIASSALIAPFVYFRVNITRTWGGVFTILYVVYIVFVLTQKGI